MKKKYKKMLKTHNEELDDVVKFANEIADTVDTANERLDTHSNTNAALLRRIERLEKRLESKAELLLKLDPEVGSHAIRISNLEDRLHDMPRRFEEIERKLDALQRDTLDLRGKVARLIPPKGE